MLVQHAQLKRLGVHMLLSMLEYTKTDLKEDNPFLLLGFYNLSAILKSIYPMLIATAFKMLIVSDVHLKSMALLST